MKYTVVIPAGGQEVRSVPSSMFFGVYQATGDFDVRLDRESPVPVAVGSKIKPEDGKFKRVTLINTSGAENTVVFYAGMQDIDIPVAQSSTGTTQVAMARSAVAPVEAVVLIAVNDTVQQIAPGSTAYCTEIRIYPAKAVVAGLLTANAAGDVYIGRTANLPDKRAVTDTDYPVVYTAGADKKIALSSIRIKGKATDGVFYSYDPA